MHWIMHDMCKFHTFSCILKFSIENAELINMRKKVQLSHNVVLAVSEQKVGSIDHSHSLVA